MPSIEQTSVNIKANDNQLSTGKLQTTHYDHGECIKRALLRLGLFWLLALASIPIIFAHWVLVPGFLIAGPWMAYRTYQKKYTVNYVRGSCPTCQEDIEIKMEAGDTLPKWTYCPRCNAPLNIIDTHPSETNPD